MERMVTLAPKGTPCGWTTYGETGTRLTCAGGNRDARAHVLDSKTSIPAMAVHILTETLPVAPKGTALCAYHSPWDVTEAERAELEGTATVPTFDESDPSTWDGPAQAAGYEWRDVGNGEFHLFSPEGRNISQAAYDKRETAEAEPLVGLPTFDPESPSGIEILRELLTLPTVKPRKAKTTVLHLDDSGKLTDDGRVPVACGRPVKPGNTTDDPAKVTCKRCPGTRRFERYAYQRAEAARTAAYAEAGITAYMVVRDRVSGHYGMVNRLDSAMLSVSFWARQDEAGSPAETWHYAHTDTFWAQVEKVVMGDLVEVGNEITYGYGYTNNGTVTAVTETAATVKRDRGEPYILTLSVLASDLNRGMVSVTAPKPTKPECQSATHTYCVGVCPIRDRNRANETAARTTVETEAQCAARIAREDYQVGDLVTFRNLVGYRYDQNRPFKCRDARKCVCGNGCYGTVVESTEHLTDVVHYVSGGIEIRGHLGSRREVRPDRLD